MSMNRSIRILVVDDEAPIRRLLRASLSLRGFTVHESASGADALRKSVAAHPDIIILDLGLPDMSGLDVVKGIREHAKTPIIILTVRDEVSDKVAALDAGADDYLTKPFNMLELFARLKAVMRRLVPADRDEPYRVGNLVVDVSTHRVLIDGTEIGLTPTEYDILRLLVQNAGNVVTHKQILQEVWNKPDDREGVMHLLRVTISNLRSKIEPDPDRPSHILTEPGLGYRLQADD